MTMPANEPIIKIRVVRESLDVKIGVSLRQEEDGSTTTGMILINSVSPDSLFVNTRLRPGMQVLKINDVSVLEESMDLRKAMQLLKESEDLIALEVKETVASTPSSPAPRHTPSTTVSNPVSPSPPHSPIPGRTPLSAPPLQVTPVSNNSPHTDGMPPVAIASTVEEPSSCSSTTGPPVASAELLEEESSNPDGDTTTPTDYIDASHECVATPLTPTSTIARILQNVIDENGVVTVTATRPRDATIGISLKKKTEGVWISSLKTFSIFNGTHLQPGMKILSVNGHACTRPQQAAELLKQAENQVTLVARFVSPHITSDQISTITTTTTNRSVSMATVSAIKPSPSARVGLSLRQEGNGTIVLASFRSDSIFSGSYLRAGMKLLKINGVDVTHKPVKDCGMLLKSIQREITLVAQEIGDEEPEESTQPVGENQDEETRQPVVSNEQETVAEEAASEDVSDPTTTASAEAEVPGTGDGPTFIEESTTDAVESTEPTEEETTNDEETDSRDKRIASGDREDIEADEGKSSSQRTVATTTFESMLIDNCAPEAMPEDDSDAVIPVAAIAKPTKKTLSLGYSLAAAFIIKPQPTSELGIAIGEKTLLDGSQVPVIVEITPDGLCADTDLEVGMRILSVNGIGCRAAEDATKMLSEADGDTVTILASLSWHMVFATVTKPTQDTKTGLTMRRNGNGMLVIKRLPSDGLFAQTGLLKEGMRICCINGTDVDELQEDHILQLVSSAEGTVTVLAENLNHCLAD